MRIYGSSPLYQYVELVFRCKRMFILAVLLGSVITSLMVAGRAAMYSASFTAQLSGTQPEVAGDLPSDAGTEKKANRLAWWIRKDPDFLPDVLRDAELDKTVPPAAFDKLVRKVRTAIGNPTLDGVYMEVPITWSNPDEAERILNAVYARYSSKTLESETAATTFRRQLLEDQLRRWDKEANKVAAARVAYLRDHYWQQPSLLGSSMANLDHAQTSLDETRKDLGEAQSRLAMIETQLRTTKPTIDQVTETAETVNPVAELKTKRDEVVGELKALQARYADAHPQVIGKKRELAAIDDQLARVSQDKGRPKGSSRQIQRMPNPQYAQLLQLKTQYESAVTGLSTRVQDSEKEIAKQTARVREMPGQEVAFGTIDRNYERVSGTRNQMENLVANARIDEERERYVKSREMKLVVKPRAEKLDSGGKTMVLYALGPFLGIVIAFVFSLFIETLDHTLRTPVEVEKYLGKPVLAVIPRMVLPRSARKQLAQAARQKITS